MIATLIEGRELLETVAASVIAGVGVTVSFSIAIWGAAQFAEHNRAGRALAAGIAGGLGALGLAVTLAAVTIGVIVMTGN